MLETVREFGYERLVAEGEEQFTLKRHAEFFVRWAEAADRVYAAEPELSTLQQFDDEIDNLRTALDWSIDRDAELAARLAGVLGTLCWEVRGQYSEGRRWLDLALAAGNPVTDATRARALYAASELATTQGDYASARALLDEALDIYRGLNDQHGMMDVTFNLARIVMFEGDYEEADRLQVEALPRCRELGQLNVLQGFLCNLGCTAYLAGDYERAREYLEEHVQLQLFWGHDFHPTNGFVLAVLGRIAIDQGDTARGSQLFAESVELLRRYRHSRFTAQSFEHLAFSMTVRGQPERVARLLGAAAGLRASVATPISPITQQAYDQHVPAAKAQLGEAAWDAAWAEGSEMSLDEAFDYALASAAALGAEPATAAPAAGLSKRETEVLRLLVDGQSNKGIAAALFISPHTAANHVANIMNKLGVDSRTAAATWAVRHGLV
jgi:non-specific serine/threonine protein kinase